MVFPLLLFLLATLETGALGVEQRLESKRFEEGLALNKTVSYNINSIFMHYVVADVEGGNDEKHQQHKNAVAEIVLPPHKISY